MISARMAGGLSALVLLVLLAVLTLVWRGYQGVVTPDVRVLLDTDAKGNGSPASPGALLAERTRQQADRTAAMTGAPPRVEEKQLLTTADRVDDGRTLVGQWESLSAADKEILRGRETIFGQTSVPYSELNVLTQPEGRDWRRDHSKTLRFSGGWLILGVSFLLALFLLMRGRIRLVEGWSGGSMLRFPAFERINHWMTATSFVVMALTGLVILYGKPLLLPIIGQSALGALAQWSAWAHMATAVPFVIGLILMAVFWLRQNLITRLDWNWLRRGGGFLHDRPEKPPARRFNAGQKIVFWGVELGGLASLVTGLALMFPFAFLGYEGMQWAQLVHAAVGLLLVALIIGHIYIGTIGMEGAFDAMWSGRVDNNWAKEHHALWYEEKIGDSRER